MRKFTILAIMLCVGLAVSAQTVEVTGVVTGAEDGSRLPGVSILIKGTANGVITDIDGRYSIKVPPGATLVFSFVGLATQEIAVGDRRVIDAVMAEASSVLDEVVVTAMGISRAKKAMGYAVQTVKASELVQAGNANLSTALQGKLSGVQVSPSSGMPGASSMIMIRGARSFTGDNSPLYVIDGMPIQTAADREAGGGDGVTGTDFANRAIDIDPNDIESIDVLKGQAAAALYGIRASNGVVMITTRSGKGLDKGKAQVSFSSNVSMDLVSRYPEVQTTYAQGSDGKYSYKSEQSWGPKISDLPDKAYNPSDYGNGRGFDGMYYVRQREAAGLDPWVRPAVYDNIREFFRTGLTWNNSLNVAQALEKSTYSVSVGTSNQTGIIPTTGMDRYTVKLMGDTKLSDNWTTGMSVSYVNTSISKMPSADDGILATVYPAPPSYDLAGIPAHQLDKPYTQNSYRLDKLFPAAYWALDNNSFTEATNRMFGNLYVDYHSKLGTDNQKLSVKYQAGVDAYTTHYQDSWGYGNKGSDNNGQIENYGWTNSTLNSLLTVNYDLTIGEVTQLTALVGNEIVQGNSKYYYQYGSDYGFAGWNHINNATIQKNVEEQWKERSVGFFGSISASWRSMLYLTVTGREDIVSHMPRGNRSFFYPSVSLGFILTEIEALKGNQTVSFAKLRASYAEVGQAGDYMKNYCSIPAYGGGFYTGTPIMYPIGGVNGYRSHYVTFDPKLKPQNTQAYELGMDVSFFNSLLAFNYTFSRQNVVDQIFEVPLAGSTGTESLLTNGGSVHTNTHELTLTMKPVRGKNIEWSFAFNFTKIDNYVDALASGVESIKLGGYIEPQVRAEIGRKFPVIYGTSYMRNAENKIVVDSRGIPMVGELKVIGNVAPDFLLGFNTSLRIYRFSLGAVIDWKSGGQMYSGTNGLLKYYGISKETEGREGSFVFDGVKEDGSKNDIAITGSNEWQRYYQSVCDVISEADVYNSSFVKLRELSLGYVLIDRGNLRLALNAFARNLLLWTSLPNFDPESTQGNNNMAGAFERFSLPQTTSYGLGINLKF